MVRSPVRSNMEVMEPPRTPIQERNSKAYHHLLGSSSPETLCPQPRRLFPDATMQFMISGNEEAEQKELMELFMGPNFTKVTGAQAGRAWDFENRPLSSVSTSAGATPSLDEQCRLQHSPAPSSAAPTPTLQEPERIKTLPPLQTQVRKVFVGGIPQHMTQDDLCAFFSSFGVVSKAWLQRQRLAENGPAHNAHAGSIQNHRGFGFVVFQDPNTVDELLGSEVSRFLELKDGRRIEVKRAKTSTDMTNEKQIYTVDTSFTKAAGNPQTPEPQMPQKGQKGQRPSQWQTCSPQMQHVSNGNNSGRAETNGLGPFWSPNPWSCNTHVAVHQPMLMPWFGDTKAQGGEKNMTKPHLQPLQETPPTPTVNEQIAPMAPVLSALEWVRSCNLHQEGQKIAKMLQAAMPDHYDE